MNADESMLNISRLFLIPIPHSCPKSIAVTKCIICVVYNACRSAVDICYVTEEVFDKSVDEMLGVIC